jgi:hypothetical protein
MADDKIKVTWDEITSSQVDSKIKHQEIIGQVQEHQYQQASQAPLAHLATSFSRETSIWYNSVVYMALFGFLGAVPGAIALNAAYANEANQEYGVGGQIFAFIIIGISLACCLGAAEAVMSRNIPEAVKCLGIGTVSGLFAGFFGWLLGTIVFVVIIAVIEPAGEQTGPWVTMLARIPGWAILGAGVGTGPGVVIRSLKKTGLGLLGGAVGGVIGGLLFDPLSVMLQSGGMSRFVGLCAVGTLTGAAIGLLENVAKTGWVSVVEGLIRGKQFIVYRNPTYIGSSPQCEIYLFKDAAVGPRHAAVHTVGGRFELEDLRSTTGTFVNGQAVTRVRLRNNDTLQIGSTVFQFHEKAKTS